MPPIYLTVGAFLKFIRLDLLVELLTTKRRELCIVEKI